MAVERINSLPLADLSALNTQNSSANIETSFKDLFERSVNKVNAAERVTAYDAASIAAGNVDALHELVINMEKADILLQTLVQVRNKALDAYNEIMRITL